jgi:hypothetical protein
MKRKKESITLAGIATAVEWEGQTIIVCADSLEILNKYLTDQKHEGTPEARQVAVMLGPQVEIAPIPKNLRTGNEN